MGLKKALSELRLNHAHRWVLATTVRMRHANAGAPSSAEKVRSSPAQRPSGRRRSIAVRVVSWVSDLSCHYFDPRQPYVPIHVFSTQSYSGGVF